MRCDVLLLGGGAAGLMAARVLKARGKRALILEGRGRLGGRIWTKDGGPLPLELGAEFVHGEAPVTTRLCAELGLTIVEPYDRHLFRRGGAWVESGEIWETMAAAFAAIPAGRDRSFFDYARESLSPRQAEIALRFVESFHGADPREISALSLRQTHAQFEEAGRSRKILGGYGALVRGLSDAHARRGERIVSVEWRPGRVRVRTTASSYSAPKAIVALPLGVLQKGGVRFSPGLDAKRAALEGLGLSQARRVSFLLEEPSLGTGLFLHDALGDFPVWWTSPLARFATVTAWRGGPRALAISRGAEKIARAQLSRYAKVRVKKSVTHDWSRDDFSFCAYSFARVNNNLSREKISRAISGTLFFAGEHAISDGESATVEGALRSGERAAKNIF